MMKIHRTKILINSLIALLLITLIGFTMWLYNGQLTAIKQAIFLKFPLPAARVATKFIPVREILKRVELAEKIFGDKDKVTADAKTQIYDEFLASQQLAVVANQYKLQISDKEIEQAYQNYVNKYAMGDESAFQEQLRSYAAMDKTDFKNQVVRQELLLTKLSVWYYEQESLNQDAYKKARAILDRLDSGVSFEEVAKAEKPEAERNNFDGDTGFFNLDDLLPEFQNLVKDAKVGQNIVAPSRYGLHIIKVLGRAKNEQGQDQMQLQQIYLEGSNFESWYKDKLKSVKTTKFLKNL